VTEELLSQYKSQIGELIIVPSSGGVFTVTVNHDVVFSKKELNRFPDDGEVSQLVSKYVPGS